MSKKGCCSGLISGCFMLLVTTGALVFFLYNWVKFEMREAEKNNLPLETQLSNSIRKIFK